MWAWSFPGNRARPGTIFSAGATPPYIHICNFKLQTKMRRPVNFVSAVFWLDEAVGATATNYYKELSYQNRCAGTKSTGCALTIYLT